MILSLVAFLAVVVVVLCGVAAIFLATGDDQVDSAATSNAPLPDSNAAPGPSRNGEQPNDDADLPAFRKALPVIVTGSIFDSGEQTDLIQREGWPFAFRVPVGWFCDEAMVIDGANNDGVECRPPGRTNGSSVAVGIRDCESPCDSETQELMNRDIASGTLIEGDATTSYTEVANPKDNVYSLFVSHFFGSEPGQPLRWQVVVRGSGPHTDRAAIQKVANDIRTQTP
ncbi:hypothetical protein [Cryptosporangium arvum]|uniref:hypothetical protein n=1 Tax=Cryptosporangium arvum TaxID=80871 RepID=UPI00055D0360|nr:hypothetical protein [Cryptosporangium arvum]